ncbi:DUF4381 domain-containing protein [Photobacterium minamisatsumaniensis]|uniref:DUF4381 domain-containing protein n=1 Tax=Photobacterium minamisatsumaniensis TaxID=2910233 RepID=UPI003D105657
MVNEKSAATLPLAELHLPEMPNQWPLAWGWWVIILIGFVVMAYTIYKMMIVKKQNQARREALTLLKSLRSIDRFNDINLLLRQVAISYYPRHDVAGLTGTQWLGFLDSLLPESKRGFVALSQQWQQGLFSSHALAKNDFDACYKQAVLWVKKANFSQGANNV